jgi:hypothetical protein
MTEICNRRRKKNAWSLCGVFLWTVLLVTDDVQVKTDGREDRCELFEDLRAKRTKGDFNHYPTNVDKMAGSYQCQQMADGI